MYRAIILITFLSLLAIASPCVAQTGKKTGIEIKDLKQHPELDWTANHRSRIADKNERAKYKHHDAVFTRGTGNGMMSDKGNSYIVAYFQMEQDTLKIRYATYVSDYMLTKADYWWNKDTMRIHLYNPDTQNEINFGAYGNGNSSSMKTYD